jgi:hypothetical protein
MRLIVDAGFGGISTPRIDSAILKAAACARLWFGDPLSGGAASIVEIGREGVENAMSAA